MFNGLYYGIRIFNNKFDPFDLKLDKGESVNENVEEYDEVFGELHKNMLVKQKLLLN